MYAVNLFALGVPYTTYVDDYVPIQRDGSPLFASVGSDEALWGPILEKAIAKYVGNYSHMNLGRNDDGISFLNGGPNYYIVN